MATIVFTPCQDVYISEYYACENFCSSPFLYISRYKGVGDIYRTLIKFDLCSRKCNIIPPNSCIESAHLKLPVYRNEICGCIHPKVYPILEPWCQCYVTWNNQPLASSSPEGTEAVHEGFFGTVSICITDLVRDWYEGFVVNNGLLLKGDETQNNLLGFFSTRYPDTSKWPKLVVEYHVNCCRDHKHCCDGQD